MIRHPVKVCKCGFKLNACTGINAKVPDEGSVSICINCGRVGFFTADLSIREPTALEMKELMSFKTIREIQKKVRLDETEPINCRLSR